MKTVHIESLGSSRYLVEVEGTDIADQITSFQISVRVGDPAVLVVGQKTYSIDSLEIDAEVGGADLKERIPRNT